ncbi:MAG: 2,3-bisphosphoglycerate-independent phosphoglycerate mutase, partial [Phycisphaerales bacterium]|nr:2,3-bisphosphoglycerate-independent phosphoglycerate mutase [Phycisphaerales bacterium]
MKTPTMNTPVVLVIRDGWGANPHPEHDAFNAVKLASQRGLTPVADALMREYPWTLIKTSGEDVGLPEGTMGNSEVGHQNIGAGRIVDQESVAITKACRGGLEKNDVIAKAISRCVTGTRADGSPARVHLLCIASDAGVHGQLDHLFACLRACKTLGARDVSVHLFTDGRDTGPFTGKGFVERVEAAIREIGVGRIATICGRYFAMDRDNRWERVQTAYDALTGHTPAGGATRVFASAAEAVQDYYDNPTASNVTGDEFIPARCVAGNLQEAKASAMHDGDSAIFVNYRGDRPRELCSAFLFDDARWARVKPSPDSGRAGFGRGTQLNLHFVIMTEYWDELLEPVRKTGGGVAFPKPPRMENILGEYLSRLGLRQFRCAETEKYPHVTFFFNDYREEPFPGESRKNPQSPKVSTYDQKPEMSASEICQQVLARLAAPDCEDVLIVNFANADMVGHTGVLEAVIKACAAVDVCVGKIIDATLKRGGSLIVTADHGNAEQMFDPETGSPHTAHTVYDVPLILVGGAAESGGANGPKLRGDHDVAGW